MVPLRYLVVGFDGSPLSELALFRALRLTEFTQFSLVHVVTVVEDEDDLVVLPDGVRLPEWSASEMLRLTVLGLAAGSKRLGRFARIIPHICAGRPAASLADFARRYQADMVLVGARGTGDTKKPLGSVPRELLEKLDIPVQVETFPLDRAFASEPPRTGEAALARALSLLSPRAHPTRVELN
ncbi:MAG: hypothetical protein B6A08_00630 [Sorangiineae bacterium NIC37A_2]|nr:MAG: hypothetical protein B6A08_00630 [Sorangiineae bacterium NIC37A_2]